MFYDVLMYPQSHLAEQIEQCRAAFDQFNNMALRTILEKEQLADSVTLDQAIKQFRAFVNFLASIFGKILQPMPSRKQANCCTRCCMD